MGFRKWWRHRSGMAKTVTVLSAVLLVQMGLCFGTEPLLGDNGGDWMLGEAVLGFGTLILILLAYFGLLPGTGPDDRGGK